MLEISIRTLQRWYKHPKDRRAGPINHPKKLSSAEKDQVLNLLNSEKYCDLSPSVVVPMLADDGQYLASESTMYRILRANGLQKHRARSQKPQKRFIEEKKTNKPNTLWSWDITYLPTPIKGLSYKLYMFVDVYSRYVVGWKIYEIESAELSSKLLIECCKNQSITGKNLRVHADNGQPMRGYSMKSVMEMLGVIPSHSRARVSNDSPYSEALFKTLKYCPKYPRRPFVNIEEARDWVEKFVDWYNKTHLHSGINFVTPEQRHNQLDIEILKKRKTIYQQAMRKNPIRWSKLPRTWKFQKEVILNPQNIAS